MTLRLSSTAFRDHGPIPQQYTGDGEDIAPPLAIEGVPFGTKSLALVVDDPDAPDPKRPRPQPFVHWGVYDLPPNTTELSDDELPRGAVEGVNDFGVLGYSGPKPPTGRHRYVFTLYALDEKLPAGESLTKRDLVSRMEGHVLEKAALVGTYTRS